jgi:hypothetical protein
MPSRLTSSLHDGCFPVVLRVECDGPVPTGCVVLVAVPVDGLLADDQPAALVGEDLERVG